ncbi:MAG: PAS domain S-box protein, partial [Candidatus Acidiferrales bacterium]
MRTVPAAHLARARETLQALQATLPVLLDTAPDSIVVVNSDGHIVLANARVENMFGYSQEELLGQPIEILLPERFRKIHPQHHEGYFAAPHIRPMGTGLDLVGRRKDGSEFPVDVTLGPLKTEEGLLVISVIRDITERKHAEETLRESEEKYRTIIQTIEDGYYEVDIAGNFTFHNDSLCRILGYSPSELMGMNNQQYADAETSKQVYQAFNKVFRTGQPRQEFNWPIIRKDGTKRYIDTSIHLMRNATGKPVGFRGILRDITERKRAEKIQSTLFQISEATNLSSNLGGLLQTIHNVLGTLLDTTNFYIALYDQNSDRYSFPYFVDQYDEVHIAPPQLKKSLTDYVRRTGRPLLVDETLHRQLEERGEVELVGTPSPIWLGVPLKTAHGVVGVVVVQNYTDAKAYSEKDLDLMTFVSGHIAMAIERKRAEEAVQHAEEKYRGIFEDAIVGIFQTTPEGRYLSVNPALAHLYGYESPQELMASVTDIGRQIYVDPGRREEFKRLMEEQGYVWNFEYQVHDKDGRKIWLLENSRAIRDARGTVLYYVGTVENITDRKRAEEALRKSEERFRSMFEATAIGVAVADMNGHLVESNRRLQEMLGYSGEELHRMVFTKFTHPEDASADMELYKELITGKRDHYQMEKRYIRKVDRVVWVRLTVSLMRGAGNEPHFAIGMVEDITERKRAEEALRQSEAEYRSLIQGAAYGIYRCTTEGKFLDVNPALVAMLGYDSEAE